MRIENMLVIDRQFLYGSVAAAASQCVCMHGIQ